MVRAFIGVSPSEEVRNRAVILTGRLKSCPIKAKFVEAENLHVSLSFLGEKNDEEIEKVKFMLDETVKRFSKFEISTGNLLLIPNENFVRVVALEIVSSQLELLRKEVVKVVGGKSHPAHLTLARISNVENKEKFLSEIKSINVENLSQIVNELHLFKSQLSGTGPSYTILHTCHLK